MTTQNDTPRLIVTTGFADLDLSRNEDDKARVVGGTLAYSGTDIDALRFYTEARGGEGTGSSDGARRVSVQESVDTVSEIGVAALALESNVATIFGTYGVFTLIRNQTTDELRWEYQLANGDVGTQAMRDAVQALDEGDIAYDVLGIYVGDGMAVSLPVILTVTISGENDAPAEDHNRGLAYDSDESGVVISSRLLSWDDADADDTSDAIIYSLTAVPASGALQLLSGGSWHMLSIGSTFTQADIDDGHLRYVPDALAPSSASFKFTVTDGNVVSDEQTFEISMRETYQLPVGEDEDGDNTVDLSGETAPQKVETGEGEDEITDSAGNDRINAGRDDDMVDLGTGGADEVIYEFEKSDDGYIALDGGDDITNFRRGEDRLVFGDSQDTTFLDDVNDKYKVMVNWGQNADGDWLVEGLYFLFADAVYSSSGSIAGSMVSLTFSNPIPADEFLTLVDNGGPNDGYENGLITTADALRAVLGVDSIGSPISLPEANIAPVIANIIDDQMVTEDTAFSLDVSGVFTDADGDTLTVTISGAPWLNFDGTTLSGTPLNEHVGAHVITLTADDGNGATVSHSFTLTVENTDNQAPVFETSGPTRTEQIALSRPSVIINGIEFTYPEGDPPEGFYIQFNTETDRNLIRPRSSGGELAGIRLQLLDTITRNDVIDVVNQDITMVNGISVTDRRPDNDGDSQPDMIFSARLVDGFDGTENFFDNADEERYVFSVPDPVPVIIVETPISFDENSDAGDIVFTTTATDADNIAGQLPTETIAYELVHQLGDNGLFIIDANTGAVRFITSPDYEMQASYDVYIRAISTSTLGDGSTREAIIKYTIALSDTNDPPEISAITGTASVAEDTDFSADTDTGLTFTASDVDVSDVLNFSVYEGASATPSTRFKVVANAGVTDGWKIQIISGAVFDYETDRESLVLRVVVDDGNGAQSEVSTSFAIENVNDETPEISEIMGLATVMESADFTTDTDTGLTFTAFDSDANDTLDFSIYENLSEVASTRFQVVNDVARQDGYKIQIIAGAVFDYETDRESIALRIVARDAADHETEAITSFAIENVNDEVPEISAITGTATTRENANFTTDTDTGLSFTATDTDAGDTLSFSVYEGTSETPSTRFRVWADASVEDGWKIQIIAGAVFDYETDGANLALRVVVRDDAGHEAEAHTSLAIENVNEAPQFAATATASVVEATGISQVVYTPTPAIPDITGDTVRYTLSGVDANLFTINETTGALTLTSNPDYETQSSYEVIITATTRSGRADERSAAQTVTITVTNAAPTITTTQTDYSINEGSTAVTQLMTDEDRAGWEVVSTTGDGSLFEIDGDGNLAFVNAPDYETPRDSDDDNVYTVQVRALDYADNTLRSDPINITVRVGNIDDNAPEATDASRSISVAESVGRDGLAFTAQPTDADNVAGQPPTETITYELVDGAGDNASFTIDEDTGEVRFVVIPDYETKHSYEVHVKAISASTLGDGSTQEAVIEYTVNLTDANDAPGVRAPNIVQISVSEGGRSTLTESQIIVWDPDVDDNDADGNPLDTMVLKVQSTENGKIQVSGVDATEFTLADLRAGNVSFVHDGSEDVEIVNGVRTETPDPTSFTLVASDGEVDGAPFTFRPVVLASNDVPVVADGIEAQKAEANEDYSFTIPDGAFSDVDGDDLTYEATLSHRVAHNFAPLPDWLSFDGSTGTFSGAPVTDDIGSITVRVVAGDGNGGYAYANFVLTVIPDNIPPTVSDISGTASGVENSTYTADTDTGLTFTVTDPDEGDTITTSIYEGTSEEASTRFKVVSDASVTNGWKIQIISGASFDYETDGASIALRVVVDDGAKGVVEKTASFTVMNADDQTPVMTVSGTTSTEEITAAEHSFTIDGVKFTYMEKILEKEDLFFQIAFNNDGENEVYGSRNGKVPITVGLKLDGVTRGELIDMVNMSPNAPSFTEKRYELDGATRQIVFASLVDGFDADETFTGRGSGAGTIESYSFASETVTVTTIDTAISVAENSDKDNVLFTAQATDADNVGETINDAITYELVRGQGDNNFFRIDKTSGEVRFIDTPDYETQTTYAVYVRAISTSSLTGGGLRESNIVKYTVNVSAVDEAPEIFGSDKTVASVNVNGLIFSGIAGKVPPDAEIYFSYFHIAPDGDWIQYDEGANRLNIYATHTTYDTLNKLLGLINADSDVTDRFKVSLADGVNGDATINLSASDWEGQTFTLAPITKTTITDAILVEEAGSVTITEAMLGVVDVDSDADDILLTASNVENGKFQLSGTDVTQFTLADVQAGNVVFIHDGSQQFEVVNGVKTTTPDPTRFTLTANDGTTDSSSVIFELDVTPVNQPPDVSDIVGTASTVEHTDYEEDTDTGLTFTAVDAIEGDTLSLSIYEGASETPSTRFQVVEDADTTNGYKIQIISGADFDHETDGTQIALRVVVDDGQGAEIEKTANFEIGNIEDAAPVFEVDGTTSTGTVTSTPSVIINGLEFIYLGDTIPENGFTIKIVTELLSYVIEESVDAAGLVDGLTITLGSFSRQNMLDLVNDLQIRFFREISGKFQNIEVNDRRTDRDGDGKKDQIIEVRVVEGFNPNNIFTSGYSIGSDVACTGAECAAILGVAQQGTYIFGTETLDTTIVDTPVSIDENSDADDVVFTVTAKDGDNVAGQTPTETVTYELVADLQGSDNHFFKIDENTGAVRFIDTPDYETQSSYNVYIRATSTSTLDGGETRQSDIIKYTVNLNNVNEPPEILGTGVTVGVNVNGLIFEAIAGQVPDDAEIFFSYYDGFPPDNDRVQYDAETGRLSIYARSVIGYSTFPTLNRLMALINGDNDANSRFTLSLADDADGDAEIDLRDEDVWEQRVFTLEAQQSIIAEGGRLTITETMLFVTDVDDNDVNGNLLGTILLKVSNVVNGKFQLSGSDVTQFTMADVRAGNVVFVHDGSEYDEANPTGFTLVASDGTDSAPKDFVLSVMPVNDFPIVANPIPDRTFKSGKTFTFNIADDTFDDVESETLVYEAMLTNGNALPSWLAFDDVALSFTGTPLKLNVGTVSVRVTVTDEDGGTVLDDFVLTIEAGEALLDVSDIVGTAEEAENTDYAEDTDTGLTLRAYHEEGLTEASFTIYEGTAETASTRFKVVEDSSTDNGWKIQIIEEAVFDYETDGASIDLRIVIDGGENKEVEKTASFEVTNIDDIAPVFEIDGQSSTREVSFGAASRTINGVEFFYPANDMPDGFYIEVVVNTADTFEVSEIRANDGTQIGVRLSVGTLNREEIIDIVNQVTGAITPATSIEFRQNKSYTENRLDSDGDGKADPIIQARLAEGFAADAIFTGTGGLTSGTYRFSVPPTTFTVIIVETPVTIDENSAADDVVLTVSATDADNVEGEDAVDTIGYELVTGWGDNSFFKIDENTGALRFKQSPDYETSASYDVYIRAFSQSIADANAPRQLSDVVKYTVNLNDMNDAPEISHIAKTGSVDVNGLVFTNIAGEAPVDATIFFAPTATFLPGNDRVQYDASTKRLTIYADATEHNTLNKLMALINIYGAATSRFTLSLASTADGDAEIDLTDTTLWAQKIFTLAPQSSAVLIAYGTDAITVIEGESITLTEAMLSVSDEDASDSDANGKPLGHIQFTASNLRFGKFQLSGVDVTQFTLADVRAGNVKFVHDGTAFDTANPPGFTLVASNSGKDSAAVVFDIKVDALPIVSDIVGTVTITENATYGTDTDIGLTFTVTEDGGLSAESFTIYEGTDTEATTRFKVVADTAVKNGWKIQITKGARLDYETDSASLTLRVVVRDATGHEVEKTAQIAIVNVDDNAPVFAPLSYSWDENRPADDIVFTAVATDADNVAGQPSTETITYSFGGGGDWRLFTIDAETGAVRFNESPDFETKSSYRFTIFAASTSTLPGGGQEKLGFYDMEININDVNEAPTVNQKILAQINMNGIILTEKDPHTGHGDPPPIYLVYSTAISPSGNLLNDGRYRIYISDRHTTVQKLADLISGLSDDYYDISFADGVSGDDVIDPTSTDWHNKTFSPVDTIIYNTGDEISVAKGGRVTITEAMLDIIDPDAADNDGSGLLSSTLLTVSDVQKGKFQRSGTDATKFSLGEVRLGHVVFIHDGSDYDYDAPPRFTLVANDGEADSAPITIQITMSDAPANATPTVSDISGTLSIAESTTYADDTDTGLTFTASDTDTGDTLSFTIYEGGAKTASTRFKVVADSTATNGYKVQIIAGATFDYDTDGASFKLRVVTEDGEGARVEKATTLTLTNVDDIAPVITTQGATSTETLADAERSFTIDGVKITYLINSVDVFLTYFETIQNDGGSFQVHTTNNYKTPGRMGFTLGGEITRGQLIDMLNDAPNAISYDDIRYTLGGDNPIRVFRASLVDGYAADGMFTGDGGYNAYAFETTSLTVTAVDTVIEVDENTGTDNVLFTVQATDGDNEAGQTATETITYELFMGQGDNNFFTIDASTGQVRFKTTPDYETKSSYEVYVRAISTSTLDGGGVRESEIVKYTVNLNDVNDTPEIHGPGRPINVNGLVFTPIAGKVPDDVEVYFSYYNRAPDGDRVQYDAGSNRLIIYAPSATNTLGALLDLINADSDATDRFTVELAAGARRSTPVNLSNADWEQQAFGVESRLRTITAEFNGIIITALTTEDIPDTTRLYFHVREGFTQVISTSPYTYLTYWTFNDPDTPFTTNFGIGEERVKYWTSFDNYADTGTTVDVYMLAFIIDPSSHNTRNKIIDRINNDTDTAGRFVATLASGVDGDEIVDLTADGPWHDQTFYFTERNGIEYTPLPENPVIYANGLVFTHKASANLPDNTEIHFKYTFNTPLGTGNEDRAIVVWDDTANRLTIYTKGYASLNELLALLTDTTTNPGSTVATDRFTITLAEGVNGRYKHDLQDTATWDGVTFTYIEPSLYDRVAHPTNIITAEIGRNRLVTLTEDMLGVHDADADDTDANGDPRGTLLFNVLDVVGGSIVLSGRHVTQFTLADVRAGNVAFGRWNGQASDDITPIGFILSVSDGKTTSLPFRFVLDISIANSVPAVVDGIDDQSVTTGDTFFFDISATAFSDADGDSLTYTATLADGTDLPDWVHLDADTGRFTGTPLAGDAEAYEIRVTANDGFGGTQTTDFTLTVADGETDLDISGVAGTFIQRENVNYATDTDTGLTFRTHEDTGLTVADFAIYEGTDTEISTHFKVVADDDVTNGWKIQIIAGTHFDYETRGGDTPLRIVAEDTNGVEMTITADFTLINLDDNAPIFAADPRTIAWDENTDKDTVVFTVQATDPDNYAGDRITEVIKYELAAISKTADGGNDNGFFTIDRDTGEVRFAATPNYEIYIHGSDHKTSYDIGIRAISYSSLGGRQTAFIEYTVTLNDTNDAPEIAEPRNLQKPAVTKGGDLTITEAMLNIYDVDADDNDANGNPLGTIVLKVSDFVDGKIQLSGVDVTQFTLADMRAGNVRFVHDGSDFDADNLPGFTIIANDGKVDGAAFVFTIETNIAPDLSPITGFGTGIESAGYEADTDTGLTFRAFDDGGLAPTNFSIYEGRSSVPSARFKVTRDDVHGWKIQIAKGATFDFETEDRIIPLRVVVRDNDGVVAEQNTRFTLTNANDSLPSFVVEGQTSTQMLGIGAYRAVIQGVEFTYLGDTLPTDDYYINIIASNRYSINESINDGNTRYGLRFSMDTTSRNEIVAMVNQLSTARSEFADGRIDVDKDGSPDQLIHARLLDGYAGDGVFIVGSASDTGGAVFGHLYRFAPEAIPVTVVETAIEIDENSNKDNVLFTVLATDGDNIVGEDPVDIITYELVAERGDNAFFKIDATTGEVRFADTPNYETQSSYVVYIRAISTSTSKDDNQRQESQIIKYTVNLNDVEDAVAISSALEAGSVNVNGIVFAGIYGVTPPDAKIYFSYYTSLNFYGGVDKRVQYDETDNRLIIYADSNKITTLNKLIAFINADSDASSRFSVTLADGVDGDTAIDLTSTLWERKSFALSVGDTLVAFGTDTISLAEGGSVTLTEDMLGVFDEDSDDNDEDGNLPDAVMLTVSNVTRGKFQLSGTDTTQFTLGDVRAGNVVFIHDDSKQFSVANGVLIDNGAARFTLVANDGEADSIAVVFKLDVDITPVIGAISATGSGVESTAYDADTDTGIIFRAYDDVTLVTSNFVIYEGTSQTASTRFKMVADPDTKNGYKIQIVSGATFDYETEDINIPLRIVVSDASGYEVETSATFTLLNADDNDPVFTTNGTTGTEEITVGNPQTTINGVTFTYLGDNMPEDYYINILRNRLDSYAINEVLIQGSRAGLRISLDNITRNEIIAIVNQEVGAPTFTDNRLDNDRDNRPDQIIQARLANGFDGDGVFVGEGGTPETVAMLEDVTVTVTTIDTPISMDENGDADTVILTVAATDADNSIDATNPDTITYELFGGQGDNDFFRIDAATGELRFAETSDYETQTSYMVYIRAVSTSTLGSGSTNDAVIRYTINLNDVNEAPEISSTPETGTVNVNGIVFTNVAGAAAGNAEIYFSFQVGAPIDANRIRYNTSTDRLTIHGDPDAHTTLNQLMNFINTYADDWFTASLADGVDGETAISLSDSSWEAQTFTLVPEDVDMRVAYGTDAIAVTEGGSVTITEAMLGVSDEDANDNDANGDLLGTIVLKVSNLQNGKFQLSGVDVTQFTLANVRAGNVKFVHDGGEQFEIVNGFKTDTPRPTHFTLTANDGEIDSTPVLFTLDVTPVNDALSVADGIADQTVMTGNTFTFTIPARAFADDDGNIASYVATLANGSALPSWLSFDADTGSFSGFRLKPDASSVTIRVTATDGDGNTASDDFVLTVAASSATVEISAIIGSGSVTENAAHSGDTDTGLTFRAVGDDTLTTSNFKIYEGTSTTASSRFKVVADTSTANGWKIQIASGATFDYEADSANLPLRVVLDDGAGTQVEASSAFSIENVDDNGPSLAPDVATSTETITTGEAGVTIHGVRFTYAGGVTPIEGFYISISNTFLSPSTTTYTRGVYEIDDGSGGVEGIILSMSPVTRAQIIAIVNQASDALDYDEYRDSQIIRASLVDGFDANGYFMGVDGASAADGEYHFTAGSSFSVTAVDTPITIDENSDDVIFTAAISDPDNVVGQTPTDILTYELESDLGNSSAFTIDVATGEVRFIGTLNYEDIQSYTVYISATSTSTLGGGNGEVRESGVIKYTININDVNEAPEIMSVPEYGVANANGLVFTNISRAASADASIFFDFEIASFTGDRVQYDEATNRLTIHGDPNEHNTFNKLMALINADSDASNRFTLSLADGVDGSQAIRLRDDIWEQQIFSLVPQDGLIASGSDAILLDPHGRVTITEAMLGVSDVDADDNDTNGSPFGTMLLKISDVVGGTFQLSGSDVTQFTLANVRAGNVVFVHDSNSAANPPSFTLVANDGELDSMPVAFELGFAPNNAQPSPSIRPSLLDPVGDPPIDPLSPDTPPDII